MNPEQTLDDLDQAVAELKQTLDKLEAEIIEIETGMNGAAHTGHEADGITAGGVPSPGRRNAGMVPWASVPRTYSRSAKTSASRVVPLRRSTKIKAARRSIIILDLPS